MLENINQQRAQMAVQQEKARQLIDGMSRFPQTENAVQASENLGGVLIARIITIRCYCRR